MLYRNDNIIINDDEIKGTIEDLKTYFRYQIAGLCLTGDEEREGFTNEVRDIADLIDALDRHGRKCGTSKKVIVVACHPMGSYIILEGGAE